MYLNRHIFVIRRSFCYYSILFYSSVCVSGRLCFVIAPFPGYLHLYFCSFVSCFVLCDVYYCLLGHVRVVITSLEKRNWLLSILLVYHIGGIVRLCSVIVLLPGHLVAGRNPCC